MPSRKTKPGARPAKPPAAPPAAPEKVREKLERGRFTLPRSDFDRIGALKSRALAVGRPTRKNELFRAGLALLCALSDESLVITLDQLEPTGKKARRKRADARNLDRDD